MSSSSRPATEIVPRRIRFRIPAGTRRHWMGDDPASTHLFNSLSVGFPRGEKFFVDAVRAYKDRITDPALAESVRRFVSQETQHSRAHEEFNRWLAASGLPVSQLEAIVERDIVSAEAKFSPEVLLAATAALEHFTALMAQALVESPDFLDSIDESVRAFWLWHALEELEHKSVAIDVYRHVGGSEVVRLTAMVVLTGFFVRDAARQQAMFMEADGRRRDVASYLRFAWRFFGPRGHFRGLLAPYLAYYRPDFHPWHGDDGVTLAKARARLERALGGSHEGVSGAALEPAA